MSTTLLDDLHLQTAPKESLDIVNQFYVACGYRGRVTEQDQVVVALQGKHLVGCVRLCREKNVLVLRGMQVRGKYQRQGVGTALLREALQWVKDEPCYCIPYTHLVKFYAAHGFGEIDPESAPPFLIQRLNKYRAIGQKMVLMMRDA